MNNTNYADIVKHDILYRVYAGRAVYGGGRADVVVKTKERVYVFEFKLDTAGIAEGALKQIDEKG
jgi:hypothetical protein